MRYRMPDVFAVGYEAIWLPPPSKGGWDDENSIGYDVFDRFDLGSDSSPTRYGSLTRLRLVTRDFHQANARVYVDWIMNHNAAMDNATEDFLEQGGYPQFALQTDFDEWGDFHPPGEQSHDPGGDNYDLFEGRLVGLIDIAQEKDHQFIRHPVDEDDPDNIPPGTIRNLPDPDNVRFYPDTDLPGQDIVNPGTSRNPGTTYFTFYPYNTDDPLQGDAYLENATSLLLRSTQYYLEVLGVDGFRLDAAKHIPTWFWDTYWDAIVYNRWTAFDGSTQIPFSFVEAVGGGGIDPYDWVRKGDGFGNRDALDLDEAGKLRDIVDSPGGVSWLNVLEASIDNRDGGLNNGSLGVHHVSSHDNANSGQNKDTFAFAYVLMRSGPAVVYHNALQWGENQNNFPRRDGRDDALGLGGNHIRRLVKLRNQFARGRFDVLNNTDPVNQSLNDIIIMQRSKDVGDGELVGNVLVGVSDLQTNGQDATDQRWVQTAFAPGTRLHEMTGNADNNTVDLPGDSDDDIAEVLVTNEEQRVLIKVPRNRNANGVNHGRGYVVYAPAVPTGTLALTNVAYTIDADPAGTPDYRQRITPIDVIEADTFEIQLTTTQTDSEDPNTDDNAVFRINRGFIDYNGNGAVDYLDSSTPHYGSEDFLTQFDPLWDNPESENGVYRQEIDAAALGEGFHYIRVMAFRHRDDGGDPIFAEFRKVIYVDREDPQIELLSPTHTCNNDVTTLPLDVVVKNADLTADRVHIFLDEPAGTDLESLAELGFGEADRDYDLFTRTFAALVSGNHRLDVLVFEETTGDVQQYTYTGIQATTGSGLGPGDINADGVRDGDDIKPFLLVLFGVNPNFSPPSDINCDGLNDADDVPGFVDLLLAP